MHTCSGNKQLAAIIGELHTHDFHPRSSPPPIASIVVGVSIILIAAIFLFARRRSRRSKHHSASDEADWQPRPGTHRFGVPSIYQPEPFLLSELSSPGFESGSFGMYSDSVDDWPRRTSSDMSPGSAGSRKSGAPPRPTRPVNIIEHDDAGPSQPFIRTDEEPETIELPPAYSKIRS